MTRFHRVATRCLEKARLISSCLQRRGLISSCLYRRGPISARAAAGGGAREFLALNPEPTHGGVDVFGEFQVYRLHRLFRCPAISIAYIAVSRIPRKRDISDIGDAAMAINSKP